MKTYLVIDAERSDESYTVNDLDVLINDLYSCELEEGTSLNVVKRWFFENHKVFVSESNILALRLK